MTARAARTAMRSARGARAVLAATTALIAVAGPASAVAQVAEPHQELLYRVQTGDTLIGIGQRLLDSPERWRDVRRLNRIDEPRRMHPDTELRIRYDWIRSEPSTLRVERAGGTTTLDGSPAAPGAVGREGSRIETGADGVVELLLEDGTRLTIPPASAVRIDRLRHYLSPEALEVQIAVERGAVDTAAARNRKRPLRIRTPSATAAVRGTEFRVRDRQSDTAIEVLDGRVAARSDGDDVALATGQGAIAAPGRAPQLEALLQPPTLARLPGRIETVAARLPFDALAGAAGYRVQVARDEAFTLLLSDTVTATPEVTIVSRNDGVLHVRARGSSSLGLEGLQSQAARIEVAARPEPPLPLKPTDRGVTFDSAVELGWAEPRGIGAYRLQVAADPAFTTTVYDRSGPEPTRSVELPALSGPSAQWWWRVAAIDGARQGPFSAARRFEQRPIGGAPSAQVDDDRIELAWADLPGHRYQLQVARDMVFAAPLVTRDLATPSLTLDALPPGVYYTRVRSIDPQGVESPFGPVQRFEIKALVRTGAGPPLRSGSGAPIELQPPR